jgi:hypothetical protein
MNSFPDYSFVFNPSPSAAPATKPGTDWTAIGLGAQDFLTGIGDVVRAVRGVPESPYRVAGSRLQEYLKSQKEDDYLQRLLGTILSSRSKESSSFDPKAGKPVI